MLKNDIIIRSGTMVIINNNKRIGIMRQVVEFNGGTRTSNLSAMTSDGVSVTNMSVSARNDKRTICAYAIAEVISMKISNRFLRTRCVGIHVEILIEVAITRRNDVDHIVAFRKTSISQSTIVTRFKNTVYCVCVSRIGIVDVENTIRCHTIRNRVNSDLMYTRGVSLVENGNRTSDEMTMFRRVDVYTIVVLIQPVEHKRSNHISQTSLGFAIRHMSVTNDLIYIILNLRNNLNCAGIRRFTTIIVM